jgi:hypothetical protein
MMVYKLGLLTAVLALSVMGTGDVQARSLGKILCHSGLSPSDLLVMNRAATHLVEPLGQTCDARRWSNPKSCSKGAVTLGLTKGACVKLLHLLSTVKRPEPATFRTWRCRVAEGSWQVSAGPQ